MLKTFDCGCSYEEGHFDIKKVSLNCPATWDLICSGNTKGVFQLEKPLGITWAKRVSPRSLEEIADLISILRPGCLESGMAEKYVKVKRGEEQPSYIHESLRPILEPTNSILVYQEQAMRISQDLAGFNLVQADNLRKAMGKKLADLMSACKKDFIEGAAKAKIVSPEIAAEIFSWIEKSQRYSFNKAHAIGYGLESYYSAFVKTHFKLPWAKSWLKMAREKQRPLEEVNELVYNCKSMGIDVRGPDLRKGNLDFEVINGVVYFGLGNIKGMGGRATEKLVELLRDFKDWIDVLFNLLYNVSVDIALGLIESGSLDYLGISRKRMEFELSKLNSLTEKEVGFVRTKLKENNNLADLIEQCAAPKKEGGGAATKNRVKILMDLANTLRQPPMSLDDNPLMMAQSEKQLLGVPVTVSAVESCDISAATHLVSDIESATSKMSLVVACNVDTVRSYPVKKGENKGRHMAFAEISDINGSYRNCVLWCNEYSEFGNLLYEGNTVLLAGVKDSKKDSFIINKVVQL